MWQISDQESGTIGDWLEFPDCGEMKGSKDFGEFKREMLFFGVIFLKKLKKKHVKIFFIFRIFEFFQNFSKKNNMKILILE